MSFEADYRAALLTYAPLAAVLSYGSPAKYALGVRMAQPAQLPGVQFQRISTRRMYAQTGRVTLCEARVQNDCWSRDNTQALSISDLLIRAIETLTLGGPGRPNFILNQWFDTEPEPEPVVYRVIVEARIYFLDSA